MTIEMINQEESVRSFGAATAAVAALTGSANDTQVGGNHYQTPMQHWDFVSDRNVPYLIANAVKYLTRWRKKGGEQDLAKARHYVQKAIEKKSYESQGWLRVEVMDLVRYAEANGLILVETMTIGTLLSARTAGDLQWALHAIDALIAKPQYI